AAPSLRIWGGRLFAAPKQHSTVAVQALAHFPAGLEERHGFLVDRDARAGARVAAFARRPLLDRERPEAAQLDPVAARQGSGDLAQDGVDDILDIPLVKVRILRCDPLNELGFDHCGRPLAGAATGMVSWPRCRERHSSGQSGAEGCQRAKRPSRLSFSIAWTAPESSRRWASERNPTASSTAAVPRWMKSRSAKRGLRRQSRTGHLGSTFFSLASQATAVSSPPSSSTSFSVRAWRPVKTRPSATCSMAASSSWRRSFTSPRNQA